MSGAVGSVTGLSGTCPTISFTLGQTAVRTNADTRFDQGSCADVKNGVDAGAAGAKQSDGSITAARVHLGPPPKQG